MNNTFQVLNDYNDNPSAVVTNVAPVATHATAAIDQLVSASKPATAHLPGAGISATGAIAQHRSDDLKIDTSTGEITVLGKAASPNGRIPDDVSVNPVDEMTRVQGELDRLQAELDEVRYDARTGTPSPLLTGRDREVNELQIASLKGSLHYAQVRAAALLGQREQDVVTSQSRVNEEYTTAQFIQGNPERAQMLKDAIARAEADDLAARIIAQRNRSR